MGLLEKDIDYSLDYLVNISRNYSDSGFETAAHLLNELFKEIDTLQVEGATDPSKIQQTSRYRFVSDSQIDYWNSKSDGSQIIPELENRLSNIESTLSVFQYYLDIFSNDVKSIKSEITNLSTVLSLYTHKVQEQDDEIENFIFVLSLATQDLGKYNRWATIFPDTGHMQIGFDSPTIDSIYTLSVNGNTNINGTITLKPFTQAQRLAIINPKEGTLVYQSDNSPGLYIYTSSGWSSNI